MKRRADVQHDGALGSTRSGQCNGPRHGARMAGDHDLSRGIKIGRRNHLPLRSLAADLLDDGGLHPQQCSHSPLANRHSLLHVLATLAHQTDCLFDRETAGSHQGGIFSQAVTRHKIRPDAFLAQDLRRGHGRGQNRGLCVCGKLQIFRGPFEAELGKRKTQRLVGLLEGAPRAGKLFRQLAAHAGILGTLTGKNESDFRHRSQDSGVRSQKTDACHPQRFRTLLERNSHF